MRPSGFSGLKKTVTTAVRSFCRSGSRLEGDGALPPSLKTTVGRIPSVSVVQDLSPPDPEEAFEDVREAAGDARQAVFDRYPPRSVGDPRLAWVESLDRRTHERGSRDLIRLHPDVWAVKPRLDVLWQNIDWQKRFRTVEYERQKDRQEMHVGPRPWPIKGTGRARHRSRMSPIWYQGGKAHPKRGLRGGFYMLDYAQRVNGLVHALSAKFGQDDVRIVGDLHLDTQDPDYILDLIDERCWGMSTLMVDVKDIFPANITAATEPICHVNLMPCYGLNVHSMLKHKTLVLTLDAVNYLEEKLLFAANRFDIAEKCVKSSTSGFSLS